MAQPTDEWAAMRCTAWLVEQKLSTEIVDAFHGCTGKFLRAFSEEELQDSGMSRMVAKAIWKLLHPNAPANGSNASAAASSSAPSSPAKQSHPAKRQKLEQAADISSASSSNGDSGVVVKLEEGPCDLRVTRTAIEELGFVKAVASALKPLPADSPGTDAIVTVTVESGEYVCPGNLTLSRPRTKYVMDGVKLVIPEFQTVIDVTADGVELLGGTKGLTIDARGMANPSLAQLADNTSVSGVDISDELSDVRLDNVTFELVDGDERQVCGIFVGARCQRVQLKRCVINGGNHAVYVDQHAQGAMAGCISRDAGENAIILDSHSHFDMEGIVVERSAHSGIWYKSVGAVDGPSMSLKNSTIDRAWQKRIGVYGTRGIRRHHTGGVYVDSFARFVVEDCVFRNCFCDGLTFDFPVTDWKKEGQKLCRVKHEVRGCTFVENTGYGIKFNSQHEKMVTIKQSGNTFKTNHRETPCAGVKF